ncbi:MAG: hypothetical protein QM757_41565 [Paludibaculum sp.]
MNRKDAAALRGSTPTVPACHMKNFIESIRTSIEPNCPFDLGFHVAHRLPHGRGKLPPGPHCSLGCPEGRYLLSQGFIRDEHDQQLRKSWKTGCPGRCRAIWTPYGH